MSFVGSYISGDGFVLTPDERAGIVNQSQIEDRVIRPFIGGAELNKRILSAPARYIINFYPMAQDAASQFKLCFERLERLVKPHRAQVKRERRSKRWWLFADQQAGLYSEIQQKNLDRVLGVTMTAMQFKFDWIPSDYIYDQTVVVLLLDRDEHFALVHSSIHSEWAYKQGASFGSVAAPRYNPSRCFETFPFPHAIGSLATIGGNYYGFRSQLMIARKEGLTAIYSRFHNPSWCSEDVARLRAFQVEMDQAVAGAYGWSGLDLGHGFHETKQGVRYTLSEAARRAVLDRLLALNHRRYSEEVKAGLHGKRANNTRTKVAAAVSSQQPDLLG